MLRYGLEMVGAVRDVFLMSVLHDREKAVHSEIALFRVKGYEMDCPICKKDISLPSQQYGNAKIPICESCFLGGDDWVVEDKEILSLLASGYSLNDAMIIENDKENKELTNMFLEEIHNLSLIPYAGILDV
jgi:hypothetical protein